MKFGKDIILSFLLGDQHKTLRYVLFFLVILIIVANDVMNNIDYLGETTRNKIVEWCVYLLTIFGFVFVNVFVLMPRFLLKGRVVAYFVSLFAFILLMLSVIVALQVTLMYENNHQDEIGGWLLINMISSFVTTSFLIAGTSSILLLRYWIRINKRIGELESATLQLELDMLKNQINPHFLLNMLNNVNVLIWKNPSEARRVVYELEDLLKYQFNESQQDKVSLTSDIRFLEDYLNLEKIRRDEFDYVVEKTGDMGDVLVPPLLFIPFVENAVKHNSDADKESYVYVAFKKTADELYFRCENSKPGRLIKADRSVDSINPDHFANFDKPGGLGLHNIRRRLALLYPGRHEMEIFDEEMRFVVELEIDF